MQMHTTCYQSKLRWLAGTAFSLLFVPLSVAFMDRPIAQQAARLGLGGDLFQGAPVQFPLMALLALVGLLVGGGFWVLRKPLPRWAEAGFFSGAAIAISLCLVEFLLKPLFGRSVPYEYFTNGTYTFAWFHGHFMLGSFPSGHSAQAASILSVLWIYYPQGRTLWIAAFAALAAALVIGQWHYVSDIVAGGYIGAAIGALTTKYLPRANWKVVDLAFPPAGPQTKPDASEV